MSEQKTFINGVFINEFEFRNGGSKLKVNIPADKLDSILAQLKAAASDGWVNLVISKNRQPTISKTTGKTIATHSLTVDEWKSNPANQNAPSRQTPQREQPDVGDVPKPETDDDSDSVPF